jgi:acyl transferase domain-containing protein
LNATRTVGALGNIIASRIARELSLGGASFALSGGELSGLHALRIAIDALRGGETDLMIVGAVDLAGDARAMLLSDSQRLPGDGACALVLKRLEDAERDGDRIYALVQGVGFDGGANAGPAAMRHALGGSGVPPETIDYIETSATGDPNSDLAIEENDRQPTDHQFILGALSPSIGHVGAAAGLACASISGSFRRSAVFRARLIRRSGTPSGFAFHSRRRTGFATATTGRAAPGSVHARATAASGTLY